MPDSSGSMNPIRTFSHLDEIAEILGSTKTTFWPFIEGSGGISGTRIRSYRGEIHWLVSTDGNQQRPVEADLAPYRHIGGIHSYEFDSDSDQHLIGEDSEDFEFASNAPFSLGVWVLLRSNLSNTLIAKYDTNIASLDREFRFGCDSSGNFELEVYDESADATRIGASNTVVTKNEVHYLAVTYDGLDDDSSMTFYLDGVADGVGNTETGSYDSIQAGDTPITIAAHLNSNPSPAFMVNGRIAMPFICGTELNAANVLGLYNIGRKLLGL